MAAAPVVRFATKEVPVEMSPQEEEGKKLPSDFEAESGRSECSMKVCVRNTFIHAVDEVEELSLERKLRRSASAPGNLDSKVSRDVEVEVELPHRYTEPLLARLPSRSLNSSEEDIDGSGISDGSASVSEDAKSSAASVWDPKNAHELGKCKPCSYFYFKADGCRRGDDCQFCHICSLDEVKAKKRQSKKELKNVKRSESGSAPTLLRSQHALPEGVVVPWPALASLCRLKISGDSFSKYKSPEN
eukprot:TRINITY_DN2471_c0_g1_i1.p1 TRINITY_DN2471_c0_g1~~TRINITY_DN2471_c0_g1_i1.p1  ORF type:complete len:245 (-),score=49.85 TRINITY_DN2471_c0_g1_i1:840-1574(-)